MKHLIRNAFVAVLSVGLAGCEWSGGGDSNSWNDSGTIANFNGNYHASGGYLVSDYSASASSTTSSSDALTYVSHTGEDGGNNGANRVSISGKTVYGSVKPGSVTIVFGSVSGSAHDNGTSGMSGSFVVGSTNLPVTGGSFEYQTGVWTLQFAPPGLPINQSISLNYSAAGGASTSSSGTSGSSGASGGVTIYAFNVQQSGNKLKIIDNNGSVYEGSFGDMRTTGNLGSGSQGGTFVNGDEVIASFSASGKSAAGVYVNMTGNFQGTVQGVSTVTTKSGSSTITTTSMALSNRRIIGTWIEDGGKTGSISGVSDSAVNVTSTTTL
jgi:hypothetical protein